MFFILSKLLNFLFMPLSWVFILLVVSFFWKKQSRKLRIGAVIILFVFSNNFILHEVNLWWEVPIVLDQDIEQCHTGVVLGGFAYYSTENDRITFRENGDRLFQAIRLLEADYIEQLIISGGSGLVMQPELKESLYVQAYLDEIGISMNQIVAESESRNTRENAINTAKILTDQGRIDEPVVLFTSAFHMRRAIACFEKQGIKVVPYSTDPMTGERIFTLDHLLFPSATSLQYWNRLIHEWVGFLTYKILGYI